MPPAGKQPKRSRKKQLADLAAHKKQLREEAADNPHTPPPALPAEDAADERMEGIAFEEAGERSARHSGAYSKRRSRDGQSVGHNVPGAQPCAPGTRIYFL